MAGEKIAAPEDAALDELCEKLAELGPELDRTGDWPEQQLRLCGEYGVYEWFVPAEWGGRDWDASAVTRGYLALSGACLTTTFILTQRTGACRRIASSHNQQLKESLLPGLVSGEAFATVGISHLTTSRRHLSRPVLRAERGSGGFVLHGFSPWVTGAARAEHVVVGASVMLDNEVTGEQLLAAIPTDLPGVTIPEPAQLTALSASHTGEIRLDKVFIEDHWIVDGPIENVMDGGSGATTGGLQTSTLALGLARVAVQYLEKEAVCRVDLGEPVDALRNEYDDLENMLLRAIAGTDPDASKNDIRTRCNSLALRSCQAALAAAKGSGYILGHPTSRWCREALFFLVWSCPQPVIHANLCELSGVGE